jgi:hypothetical protein
MNRAMRHRLIFSTIAGIITGSVFLTVGIDHNAQSEFVSTSTGTDLIYCAELFGTWFLVGAAASACVHLIAGLIWHSLRGNNQTTSHSGK